MRHLVTVFMSPLSGAGNVRPYKNLVPTNVPIPTDRGRAMGLLADAEIAENHVQQFLDTLSALLPTHEPGE